jgi:predicted Rossmann-fold nucleotide-binding protein
VIHDKPAIAVLGPANGETAEAIVASVASALASNGYAVIVSGHGQTATSAAQAASAQGGSVLIVAEDSDAAAIEPLENQTLVCQPNLLRCTEEILKHADALLVLPGDLQVLAAVTQIWAYGTTQDGPYRPVILLGDEWPRLIKALATAANLDRKQRAMVTFASAPDEAVESLRYFISA